MKLVWNLMKRYRYWKEHLSGHNILLTGIPRSGTTLLCRLLTELPEVIALNEPLDHKFFTDPIHSEQSINQHFEIFRRDLFFHGRALARGKDGRMVDNAFAEEKVATRQRVITRQTILFTPPKSADFTLIMKHCAEFTLLLPQLRRSHEIFAQVRNPLAVLASWHSVNVAVSRGRVAKSARLNPTFHGQLNQLPDDLLTRQLFILSWYFEQFQEFNSERIIRYEELIANPDAVIKRVARGVPIATTENIKLENKNNNVLYQHSNLSAVVERLLASEGAYWDFYERQDVIDLANKMKADYGE